MKKSFILYGVLALAFISSAAIYNNYSQDVAQPQISHAKDVVTKKKSKPTDPTVLEMLSDLKSASKKLSKLEEFKFNNKMDITVSDSTGTVSETSSSNSILVKKGDNIYFQQDNIKRVQNSDYSIMVIPDEKIVVVNSPDKSMEDYFIFFNSGENMDSFASNISEIQKQVSRMGEKTYTYLMASSQAVRYTVTFGTDGTIRKTTTTKPLYIEKTGNTLVNTMTYSCNKMSLDANDRKSLDLKSILISSKKKLALTPKYSGYNLQDNRMKK